MGADNKIIALGCDHAGFKYKEIIKQYLVNKGFEVMDFGTHSEQSVDYPDFIHPLATAVESGKIPRGIILCGSGNGVSMVANKHQGIRAALCWNAEIVKLARLHNDANILSVPARFVDEKTALEMTDIFLDTTFEGGRHQNRINKIPCNCD